MTLVIDGVGGLGDLSMPKRKEGQSVGQIPKEEKQKYTIGPELRIKIDNLRVEGSVSGDILGEEEEHQEEHHHVGMGA